MRTRARFPGPLSRPAETGRGIRPMSKMDFYSLALEPVRMSYSPFASGVFEPGERHPEISDFPDYLSHNLLGTDARNYDRLRRSNGWAL